MSLRPFIGLTIIALATAAGAFTVSAQQAQRTRSPHGNLEIRCQSCHVSEAWRPVRAVPDFDHNKETEYPLLGQHRKVACASCHVTPVFRETPQNCSSCHADIHRRQFGASCEGCHSVQGWRIQLSAVRQHVNRFPLTGAHAASTCESCHHGAATAVFTGLSTACASCHLSEYNSARTIDHRATGFGMRCEGCHRMDQWKNPNFAGGFDHTKFTRFPLTGSHVSASCEQCHPGNRFAGTSQECASCHGALYDSAVNPDHKAAAFPRNCALCHGTVHWTPASFDHSRTQFPLMGAHVSTSCASCHTQGRFAGTPTTCVSCHLAKFHATTSPNHVAAAFPQDCQLCHTSVQWLGAKFDHSTTRFPLTGAHTSVQCTNCHVANQFTGTPTLCYSCHSSAFSSVTNPNHVAAAFPTTCESCHTTTTWTGARVTHRFPIYTGAHAGKWSTCNECHTNSSNYRIFTCLTCHAHDRAIMDEKHRGRTGYTYDSLACYSCHPDGRH
ncbi:MAG TPA: hypothetical protein VFR18_13265 [Terriglobia bacterium]|nr:hypothetical protein [Terriglobia bacterium]